MVPLALGNFLVNFLKASAGITARVVSTVALAIVPFKAVGPILGRPGRGPSGVGLLKSGRIELARVELGRRGVGGWPKSTALTVVSPSSSISDLESRIVASSADEIESRCLLPNEVSDDDRGRLVPEGRRPF